MTKNERPLKDRTGNVRPLLTIMNSISVDRVMAGQANPGREFPFNVWTGRRRHQGAMRKKKRLNVAISSFASACSQ